MFDIQRHTADMFIRMLSVLVVFWEQIWASRNSQVGSGLT
jgi:hypothetical protein